MEQTRARSETDMTGDTSTSAPTATHSRRARVPSVLNLKDKGAVEAQRVRAGDRQVLHARALSRANSCVPSTVAQVHNHYRRERHHCSWFIRHAQSTRASPHAAQL
ncbi:hypothetical protein OBBRIDRAFT_51980 [Obba rivulosa]|uniref:Uncharacterized protein n=1 Tax=Obba rivulosa TaxID=1052685 RepID=A0A8E2J5A2_9APHY|nr:hypothetical protein OBBRIDRAFT_51980 [Obba rivulosa]